MAFGLKKYHRDECTERLRRFCLYRERCVKECKDKLRSWGYFGLEADEIINQLYAEKFIDEGRFAESFARGKFNNNNWGKSKIIWELKQKGISIYNIENGINSISDEEYEKKLLDLYERKKNDYGGKGLNSFQLHQKISNFLVQKGFSYNDINKLKQ